MKCFICNRNPIEIHKNSHGICRLCDKEERKHRNILIVQCTKCRKSTTILATIYYEQGIMSFLCNDCLTPENKGRIFERHGFHALTTDQEKSLLNWVNSEWSKRKQNKTQKIYNVFHRDCFLTQFGLIRKLPGLTINQQFSHWDWDVSIPEEINDAFIDFCEEKNIEYKPI